ncbi:phosphatase PAP2 family protein [Pseudoflavonifractor phocaeensis]|uniref:phosphatase PAP2 family protein n=1 Tax=Pseudoflavonifractor phocaeensis TaxID=1870988 RepID=UPI00210C5F96|nr:phosphatase PAP2 family protein [Pseudoflavonifractor phocaeensis]MCQ4864151.1 phosphatase PAP2 family protein [Pseudoflavonifractor phocaeensis]
MTKELYAALSAPFRAHPEVVRLADKALTLLVYLAYPALLLCLLLARSPLLLRAVLTPGVSFVIVSLFRRVYNAPRPYEVLDIAPLIHKDTHGKSFPSRHVFSVFVITAVFFRVSPPLGALLAAVGVLIALIRVIGGVHFPKDVLAGALIGLLSGAAGLWLIP